MSRLGVCQVTSGARDVRGTRRFTGTDTGGGVVRDADIAAVQAVWCAEPVRASTEMTVNVSRNLKETAQ